MTPLARRTLTASSDVTVPALKSMKAERSLTSWPASVRTFTSCRQIHLLFFGVEDAESRLELRRAALVVGHDAGAQVLQLDEVRLEDVLRGGGRRDLIGPGLSLRKPLSFGLSMVTFVPLTADLAHGQARDVPERVDIGVEDHGGDRQE